MTKKQPKKCGILKYLLGTINQIGTMVVRTLLKSDGTEKEGDEKNRLSTQAKGGRREKSSLTTQETFWCVYK